MILLLLGLLIAVLGLLFVAHHLVLLAALAAVFVAGGIARERLGSGSRKHLHR